MESQVVKLVKLGKTMYSVMSGEEVSGYSARSDLKPSRVAADAALAGRRFQSLTVLGKKEFASIWSFIRSWNSLCCPLVRESALWRNLSALMSTRLLRILYIIASLLCFRRCSRDSQLRSFNILETHPGVFVE